MKESEYTNNYVFMGTVSSIDSTEIVIKDHLQKTENFVSEPKFTFTKKSSYSASLLRVTSGDYVCIKFEVKGYPPKGNYKRYNKLLVMGISVKRNGVWCK